MVSLTVGMLTTSTRIVPTLQHALGNAFYALKPFTSSLAIEYDHDKKPSRAWCRLLLRLLPQTPSNGFILMLEDDILMRPDFYVRLRSMIIDRALTLQSDRFGCVSLYLPRRASQFLEKGLLPNPLKPGVYKHPSPTHCWGSQALLFTSSSACTLIKKLRPGDNEFAHIDYCVFHAIENLQLSLYYHVPSLVTHELGHQNSATFQQPNAQREDLLGTDY